MTTSEATTLLPKTSSNGALKEKSLSMDSDSSEDGKPLSTSSITVVADWWCGKLQVFGGGRRSTWCICLMVVSTVFCVGLLVGIILTYTATTAIIRDDLPLPSGHYVLVDCQEGLDFFDSYSFYDGPDSSGSAGYNVYVSKNRAVEIGIANTTLDPITGKDVVFMSSKKTGPGPRESIRLEGNQRYQHGLFIFDLDHMPTGCGVWPAVWLTDENNWPNNGEIDFVEGINNQPTAKTALHTSNQCDMYAHVPPYSKTGVWDTATGIPNTWTGELSYLNRIEADNCWVMAPHQWMNQGCVTVDLRNNTLGAPLNQAGGGIFVLEWDPAYRRIRSWVFPRADGIPENLQATIDTAAMAKQTTESTKDQAEHYVAPDTEDWGLPYAYFAIGETTGCSRNHFKDMRVVINLAFCGTVAGNRFGSDCPKIAAAVDGQDNPWSACNAYIESNPADLLEAYWKIRGAYVYQRSF